MLVLEFTKAVDDIVEADLHGVHDRIEVRLGLDCLKVVVVSRGRGEVLGKVQQRPLGGDGGR